MPVCRILIIALIIAPELLSADKALPASRQVSLPTTATAPADLAKIIAEQTGAAVDVSALDDKPIAVTIKNVDFWPALEGLAEATNSHIEVAGNRIGLKPGRAHAPASVSGPFRIAAREVLVRGDVRTGKSTYAVTLDLNWEPAILALRSDTVPRITTAKDDTGQAVEVGGGGSRVVLSGKRAELMVRATGVKRTAKSLTLAGTVAVTIADEMLTFTFAADKPAAVPAQKGLQIAVKKAGADGVNWVAEFDIKYPKSTATIESFEFDELMRISHDVRLISPRGDAISADLVERYDMRYGFKNLADKVGPGWKLEYRTPGPLREIVVPFELKNIPLP